MGVPIPSEQIINKNFRYAEVIVLKKVLKHLIVAQILNAMKSILGVPRKGPVFDQQ